MAEVETKQTQTKAKPKFDETKMTEGDLSLFRFVKTRMEELKEARKNVHGINIEKIWEAADKDYIPHRLGTTGKRVLVEDEDKGWRSALVRIGTNNWQSDISQPNPFIKIQTALAILVDQNPSGVFTAATKKFAATTELIKQLYQRSWEIAKSKAQLKLFIFNLAKYGWAVGRTYPLKRVNKVRELVEYDEDKPENSTYEEKEVVEFNDVMRENLDPWNVWIDDMAKPNNEFSVRDWMWRKVYSMEVAKLEFGNFKNWKYVESGGIVTDKISGTASSVTKNFKDTNLVEIYFYENRVKDLFMVIANGVPIVIEPLPISDARGSKRLSLWQAYWVLRHAESPYGVGIYESIRYDTALLDRIRNMTIDQLTLSIYKMWFYQGTQSLTETGDIQITPGVGKQTLDPKNINWLNVPGPGNESWQGIEMLRRDIDESSGITETLIGAITGKTAFEIAQAKEAALKRLKTPLENITEALNTEGYITVSLIDLIYSIPETYSITEPDLIQAYLNEIEGDSELYERDENDNFTARVFREFPLNLDKDEKNNLIETEQTKFFRVKPRFLKWEGIINIKSQSILTPSKQVDKALDLEMYNILIPLLAQPPELYGKIAKSITKLYDKDPKDVLPDAWINPESSQNQPLFVGQQGQQPGQLPAPGGNAPQAPTAVSATQPAANPQGLVQRAMSRLTAPFRR